MAKRTYCYVVFTNAVSGREEAYNDWYTNTHLPDVLAVPGFVSARRFKLADEASGLTGRYLALYEIETDDPQAVLKDLSSRAGTPAMRLSDAMDTSTASATLFEAITSTVRPRG